MKKYLSSNIIPVQVKISGEQQNHPQQSNKDKNQDTHQPPEQRPMWSLGLDMFVPETHGVACPKLMKNALPYRIHFK
jgi:hypothetical protein